MYRNLRGLERDKFMIVPPAPWIPNIYPPLQFWIKSKLLVHIVYYVEREMKIGEPESGLSDYHISGDIFHDSIRWNLTGLEQKFDNPCIPICKLSNVYYWSSLKHAMQSKTQFLIHTNIWYIFRVPGLNIKEFCLNPQMIEMRTGRIYFILGSAGGTLVLVKYVYLVAQEEP